MFVNHLELPKTGGWLVNILSPQTVSSPLLPPVQEPPKPGAPSPSLPVACVPTSASPAAASNGGSSSHHNARRPAGTHPQPAQQQQQQPSPRYPPREVPPRFRHQEQKQLLKRGQQLPGLAANLGASSKLPNGLPGGGPATSEQPAAVGEEQSGGQKPPGEKGGGRRGWVTFTLTWLLPPTQPEALCAEGKAVGWPEQTRGAVATPKDSGQANQDRSPL